jgi:hypothetical protein
LLLSVGRLFFDMADSYGTIRRQLDDLDHGAASRHDEAGVI